MTLFSVSLVRMMSGAAAPAVVTAVTSTTAGDVTTPRTTVGEVRVGPTEPSQGNAAAVVMTWWNWIVARVPVPVPGTGEMTTMTASCERPWRGRSWVSSRGRAAESAWTARATAWIGAVQLVVPLPFLWTRPLDILVAMTTSHLLYHRRTVMMKVCHPQRKATSARWVASELCTFIKKFVFRMWIK